MRTRTIAALLSLLGMGIGQFYNRQWMKGLLLLLVECGCLIALPAWKKGIRMLIHLGEQPSRLVDGQFMPGDHSIFMMVQGLLTAFGLLLMALLYAWNVRDAFLFGRLRESGVRVPSFRESLKRLGEEGYPFLLMSPAFMITLLFTMLPIAFGVLVAFTNYAGPNHLPPRHLVDWVGFQTFKDLLTLGSWSGTFVSVGLWTIVWAVLATGSTFFFGLFVAVVVQHPAVRFKKLWRTIFIVPYAVPGFVSILIMRNLFNGSFGPLNQYLQFFGLPAMEWLSDPMLAKFTVLLVNLWLAFPYFMFMMTGVMSGISKDLYEAAEVDGAGRPRQFVSITLPMVLLSTAPLLIMNFAFNFTNFNLIYLLTEGNPVNNALKFAGETDILLSWIFKLTLEQNQFNLASAVSILVFIVIASFSIVQFRFTRAQKERDLVQ
ncbi:carbohydrate ABC transporter permease [Paenibacillus methanolicus]|uniref:Maltose/maltodextrin transport system permease protein n=1 Tax=Paenibacillus methanolicus TaxID=582686 RepID=A0A5S5CHJ5_9BACL|nr:sugar ABC transporter permease [Paenibacillus methanolicus]TYP79004.1 arabinogalactan oligomer/maltooligosaccharide transport system permease protein [Paenibacillus methanolicus]